MEIDVTYCKFARLNDVCASPINKQECKCSKIPIQMCYYKQLQQYKQLCEQKTVDNFDLIKENEDLKEKLNIYKNLTEIQRRDFNEIFERCAMLKHCLDEIEEIVEELIKNRVEYDVDKFNVKDYLISINKKIKEVKESE